MSRLHPLFSGILHSFAEALSLSRGNEPCQHPEAHWSRLFNSHVCVDCDSILPLHHPAVAAFENREASRGLAAAFQRCPHDVIGGNGCAACIRATVPTCIQCGFRCQTINDAAIPDGRCLGCREPIPSEIQPGAGADGQSKPQERRAVQGEIQ